MYDKILSRLHHMWSTCLITKAHAMLTFHNYYSVNIKKHFEEFNLNNVQNLTQKFDIKLKIVRDRATWIRPSVPDDSYQKINNLFNVNEARSSRR